MSLTSYRAAPPRGGCSVGWIGRPGGDLLSRALRRSTMGAGGFHGRVRDGIGCGPPAMATRSSDPSIGSGEWVSVLVVGYCVGIGRVCVYLSGFDFHARHGLDEPFGRLVPVSFGRCRPSTPGLSTRWSIAALIGKPGFEVGFPLRCFQRLSRPYLATRLCRWRDNRCTRGMSIPVLSY